MTSREEELRASLKSSVEADVLKAALELANDLLIPRGDYVEAETILLEVVGLQTHSDGYVVQRSLGELYIFMQEFARSERFLTIAGTGEKK
jgi:hypothetical protein